MGILDFILNLIGLLLWLGWRAVPINPVAASVGAPLLRTLKPAEGSPRRRWPLLLALGLLLLFRAVIYRQLGPSLNWTPQLRLIVVSLPFNSDSTRLMMLFSGFSFAVAWGVFYLSLIALSIVNRRVPDTDPIQRLVRLHLGGIDRLPVLAKFIVSLLVPALLWLACSPLFVRLGMLPPPQSWAHTAQQAGVMALATLPAWQYVILGVLLLHLLNAFIYLGNAPLWNFVALTARNLLAPFQWLPVRFGKLDLLPGLAMAAVFVLARWATDGLWGAPALLTVLYQKLPL